MSRQKKSAYSKKRVIFKSFLSNVKSYSMLFSCFVLCVSVIFIFISTYVLSQDFGKNGNIIRGEEQ